MPEALVIGLLIVFPLSGLVVRRWGALVLALVGWPVFYLGLDQGWWGHGTGDGWQYPAALLTAFSVVTTAGAVVLGRYTALRVGRDERRTLASSR